MKKLLILLIFLMTGLSIYSQGIIRTNPFYVGITESDTSLIAQYLFENDLTDEMGNYDGTGNGTLVYDADSHSGSYSLEMDNSADAVDLGIVDLGVVDLGAGAMSFTLWHKSDNTETNPGARILFGNKSSSLNSDGIAAWLNTWASTDRRLYLYAGNGSTQDNASTGTYAYNNGAWNFLAYVYDGDDWAIYVNGVNLAADVTALDDFDRSSNHFIIGNFTNFNYCGIGLYDDFRIYNKALSQAEVTQIYGE